jgi:probable rRNA maturation factor
MKALRVWNRQKTRPVAAPLLRQIARCLADDLLSWKDYEIAIYLISSTEMARLNETFLQHEGSTDVITFDYTEKSGPWRGEIFISMEDAARQAKQFRCAWQEEVARYMVHGVLHLAGCDDTRLGLRRVMKRRENKLLKDLSRRFDLRKLERPKNV